MAEGWEHSHHDADIGVRGRAETLDGAFRQAALALTAVVTDPARVRPLEPVDIACRAPDLDLLLADWLNAIILEMAVRGTLYGRFDVRIDNGALEGTAWGEPVDRARHHPVVEIKGATYTQLSVERNGDEWIAQAVLDV